MAPKHPLLQQPVCVCRYQLEMVRSIKKTTQGTTSRSWSISGPRRTKKVETIPRWSVACTPHACNLWSTFAGCISWRQTHSCSVTGTREPQNDKMCDVRIDKGWSGFCECVGGIHAMEKGCEPGAFDNCTAACAASDGVCPILKQYLDTLCIICAMTSLLDSNPESRDFLWVQLAPFSFIFFIWLSLHAGNIHGSVGECTQYQCQMSTEPHQMQSTSQHTESWFFLLPWDPLFWCGALARFAFKCGRNIVICTADTR